MGQPATLVVDIETVGQDHESIPARAREILLDVETDEERQKVLDCLGLDPCTGRIICIGVHWIELDRSRAYCQPDERELLANFWNDIGQSGPSVSSPLTASLSISLHQYSQRDSRGADSA
jgi:hypothetical protein